MTHKTLSPRQIKSESVKELESRLNDSHNWSYMVKQICGSCDISFDQDYEHYRQSGNFCPPCLSIIANTKSAPLELDKVFKQTK